MQDLLQNFLKVINSSDPSVKFYLGALSGIIFTVFVRFLSYIRKNRKPKGVYIKGERGDILIHQTAIADFINKVLSGRVQAQVQKVFIYTKKSNHYLTVYISVPPAANVTETDKTLHDIVFQQVSEKLGIDNLEKVDIIVKDFKTKEKSLEKKNQKLIDKVEEKSEALS